MQNFASHISKTRTLIGMVHVLALPGTPKNTKTPSQIINHAINEAVKLKNAGFDAILVENMHDIPYIKQKASTEITSMLSIICHEIKAKSQLPVGIQILAGANKEALGVAYASGIDFIRAEGFVFGHLADEGYMESCAGELLRYRKQIGAEQISIFTDIKKKHSSHAITTDISIEETAEAAGFFLSDGIILTGSSTGKQTSLEELKKVQLTSTLPILIGSGLSAKNIELYMPYANAFIVGSSIKKDAQWFNDIEIKKAEQLATKFQKLKNN